MHCETFQYLTIHFVYCNYMKMRILEKRPGGQNALCSKLPILEILGTCARDRLGLFQGKDVWIVNFSHSVENNLKRTIKKLSLEGTDLEPSEISDALLKAFPTNEKYEYILSDSARKCLRELDIPIDDKAFGSSRYLLSLVKELFPQIAKTHLEPCIYLVERLMSEAEPPFEDIISSGIMPDLVKGIERAFFEPKYSASCIHILSKLLRGKNEDEVKAILDTGFFNSLEDYFLSARELVVSAFGDSCRSLEYIISTSVTLRDIALSSGVLDCFLIFVNRHHPQASRFCIELWKTICSSYKDSSPIDFSLVDIKVERMAPLLTSRNDELVEFVGSVLSLQVKNLRLSGEISMVSFSSYAAPIVDLVLSCNTMHKTFVRAFRVFYLLTELDFFGSIANELDRSSVDSMLTLLEMTTKTIEDENMVKQACKSMGYMVRMVCCRPERFLQPDPLRGDLRKGVIFDRLERYVLPWIETLVRLSSKGAYLTILQHQLLLFISNSIEKGDLPKKRISIVRQCLQLEDRLEKMSFAELTSLLQLDDNEQDVQDELKVSLQKQTSGPIEDQIDMFIDACLEEGENVSVFICSWIHWRKVYSLARFSLRLFTHQETSDDDEEDDDNGINNFVSSDPALSCIA